jgi:ribosomal protein S21
MGVVRAKAELKDLPYNASYDERWSAFKKMLSAFNKSCSANGVQHEHKKHEHYESPGEKKRRKSRESDVNRLKSKLKENFPEKKKRDQ